MGTTPHKRHIVRLHSATSIYKLSVHQCLKKTNLGDFDDISLISIFNQHHHEQERFYAISSFKPHLTEYPVTLTKANYWMTWLK
jgi:hypothetical protein